MLDSVLKQRFLELPDFYRQFVASDFATEAAALYGTSLGLNEEQTAMFEDGIILLLLFVFTKQDLVEYLTQDGATSFRNAIPVVDALFESVHDFRKNSAFDELRREAPSQRFTTVTPPTHNPTLRTMPMDMQASTAPVMAAPSAPPVVPPQPAPTPVYQSSQATILNQPPPPPYIPPTPQWDTDARQ